MYAKLIYQYMPLTSTFSMIIHAYNGPFVKSVCILCDPGLFLIKKENCFTFHRFSNVVLHNLVETSNKVL